MNTEAEKQVVICWQNTDDGQEGEGSMPIQKRLAEDLISEMEKKYPYVIHWTREVECPNS